jgi:hypothetical protein
MPNEAYVRVPWATLGRVYRKGPVSGSSSIAIEFYDADGKIGTLKIGRARAVWKPPYGQRGYKLSIEKLGELFEEHGY